MNHSGWIKIGTKSEDSIESRVNNALKGRLASGEFADSDVKYIQNLKRPLLDGTAHLSPSKLEKLRRLCQLWDIEFRAANITSHRRFVGPLIVSVKKLFLPVLKVLLKDLVRQQRDFNAAAISLLSELSNEDPPCAPKSASSIIE